MESVHNISIYPPPEGGWKTLRPPGHHPYAFDFVQLDDGRRPAHAGNRLAFNAGKIPSRNFSCWSRPDFAPLDGVVLRIGNGSTDHEYTNIGKAIGIWYGATFRLRPRQEHGGLDIRADARNYVMIQAREGCMAFPAHFGNRSMALAEGAHVRRSEAVGTVGNSGNSKMPHRHINLFDQMENPVKAKVLPFVSGKYETPDINEHRVVNESATPGTGAVVRLDAQQHH